MVFSIMTSINITMINNIDINIDIILIIFIKKYNLNINYSLFYRINPIKTKTITQYNIIDYKKYISQSDIVIDMNPILDNYKNLLYCISHNIPIITNKKYVNIKNNNILFTDINDIYKIFKHEKINKYINYLLENNKISRDDILLEYKIDTVRNISYNIKKKNNNNILNMYVCLVDLNKEYRLSDYISCIKKNLNIEFLNKLYLFKIKNFNTDYLPNFILDHKKISIITVENYNLVTIMRYINNFNKNINCILNLDIYILNTENFVNCLTNVIKNKNIVYTLSRIEGDNNKYWDHPKLKDLFYSLSQDLWLFYGKIKIEGINEDIILGNLWNDLLFNQTLLLNNYKIINIGRSIPVVHHDTYIMVNKNYIDPIRVINKRIDISIQKINLIPDQSSIKKCSIDELIRKLNIGDDDIYDIKKYILNKYVNIT